MGKRIGKQTVRLAEGVVILSAAATVGQKEAEGPLFLLGEGLEAER